MRIAMFMPDLAPESLGWAVHLDFANDVRELGHRFDMLTTVSRPVSTSSANGSDRCRCCLCGRLLGSRPHRCSERASC